MTIYSDSIAVLELAKTILQGCENLNQSASRIKEECDQLGFTLRDDSYERICSSLEIATLGYTQVQPDIEATADAMESFAAEICAGKEQLLRPIA